MDAKITKVRLGRMLSYDWLKIVGAAAALIFIWILVFTTTATKVIPSQRFVISNYMGNATLQNAMSADLSAQLNGGKFSHEILEVETVDLPAAQDVGYQLLEARTATNEIDLMFVSMQDNTATGKQVTNENGEEIVVYEHTYLESFLYSYAHTLHYLGDKEDGSGYFQQMRAYLNTYYVDGYESGENLDVAKVEADFRARAEGDKRYKKEGEIQKGIEGDIARIESYRTALLSFEKYLEEGVVEIVNTAYEAEDKDFFEGKGEYSINVAKTEATSSLSRYVGYHSTYLDENGKEQYKVSADNMNVCLFNSNGTHAAHRFEGLVYIVHLLDTVTA